MTELRSSLHGLWLPLITPFRDGALDEASLRELVRHYLSLPIRGLILAATTGEGLTLDPHETERLVFAVRDEARKLNNLPICLGLAGSSTAVLLEMLAKTAVWPIDGYRSNVVATRLTWLMPANCGVSNPNGAAVRTLKIEAY
jgi:4-hydroxy-tetrahydrodipicolinate synthase